MLALRRAFPGTAVIQYANFPQSALPDLIAYMKQIGVGLGGPDVYPRPSNLSDPENLSALCGARRHGAARRRGQSPGYSVAARATAAFNRARIVPPRL
jgi:hypothetical protein